MEKRIVILFENILVVYISLSVVLLMSSYRYFNFANFIDKFLLFILVIFSVLTMFFSKYRFSEFFLLLIAMFISIIFVLVTKDTFIMILLVLSIAFTKLDQVVVIKKVFVLSTISAIFVVVSFKLGIITQYVMYRGGTPRFSLGFYHPNTVGVVFFMLIAEYFYIKRDNLKLIDFVLSTALAMLMYRITDSRTTLIVILFLIISIFFVRFLSLKRGKKFLYFCLLLPILFPVLSIWAVQNYQSNNFVYKINQILSGRIYYGNLFINTYGIHMFGDQNVKIIGTKQVMESYGAVKGMILDNSYLLTLVDNGVFILILLTSLYLYLMFRVLKNENYYLLVILIGYLILGLSESFLFNYHYNIFLLFIATPFFQSKKRVYGDTSLITTISS